MRATPAAEALAVLLAGAACGGTPSSPGATPGPADSTFASGDARLHYAIDVPAGRGPFPAVVIGHGSGPVTKADGAAYVPLLVARGFAVMRYDKRGVGQSTGTYRGVSAANSVAQIAELGGDLAAAAAFLAQRPDVDGGRIGFLGTSQAGWVMVSALEHGARVRFAIAVTGSVLPVGVNIRYEDQRAEPIEQAYAAAAEYTGPRGYDPAPGLRASTVPTLWLLGADDRLVPTRLCERVLGDLAAGGAPVRWQVYPGAEHGLLSASYWPDIDRFLGALPP